MLSTYTVLLCNPSRTIRSSLLWYGRWDHSAAPQSQSCQKAAQSCFERMGSKGKATTKGGTHRFMLGLQVKYTPCLGVSLSLLLFPVVAVKRPRSLQFERGRIFKEQVKIYFQNTQLTIFVDNIDEINSNQTITTPQIDLD